MTYELGGRGAVRSPEAPKPPDSACVWASTYSQARRMRGSLPSAPSWSRKMTCQAVPRYFVA